MDKPKAGWFVVQVETAREQQACGAIERACAEHRRGDETYAEPDAEPILEECFCPMIVHRLKHHGVWHDVKKPLLPGYVIAVTRDPVELFHCLREVRSFTRMLTLAQTIVPLREDERTWIEDSTQKGDRVVPISLGHRVGDTLVVTSGPLKGREASIIKVIRKKCLAVVEVHVGQKRLTTTVGLAVLPASG